MVRQIVFKVDLETGKLSVDAQGFKGKACLKETDKLLAGLTAKQERQVKKGEYYATETVRSKVQR